MAGSHGPVVWWGFGDVLEALEADVYIWQESTAGMEVQEEDALGKQCCLAQLSQRLASIGCRVMHDIAQ